MAISKGVIEPTVNDGIVIRRIIEGVVQDVDLVGTSPPTLGNYSSAVDVVKNWLGTAAGTASNIKQVTIIMETLT